jgi:hypothetical protein
VEGKAKITKENDFITRGTVVLHASVQVHPATVCIRQLKKNTAAVIVILNLKRRQLPEILAVFEDRDSCI